MTVDTRDQNRPVLDAGPVPSISARQQSRVVTTDLGWPSSRCGTAGCSSDIVVLLQWLTFDLFHHVYPLSPSAR